MNEAFGSPWEHKIILTGLLIVSMRGRMEQVLDIRVRSTYWDWRRDGEHKALSTIASLRNTSRFGDGSSLRGGHSIPVP